MSERRNLRNRERRYVRDLDFPIVDDVQTLTPWSTARALRAERRAPLQAAYAALSADKRGQWMTSKVRTLALQQGEDIRAKQRARADG